MGTWPPGRHTRLAPPGMAGEPILRCFRPTRPKSSYACSIAKAVVRPNVSYYPKKPTTCGMSIFRMSRLDNCTGIGCMGHMSRHRVIGLIPTSCSSIPTASNWVANSPGLTRTLVIGREINRLIFRSIGVTIHARCTNRLWSMSRTPGAENAHRQRHGKTRSSRKRTFAA
jgi:hypothetical protein